MSNDPVIAKTISLNDHYRTMLRKALDVISKSDTIPDWISECERIMADTDADSGDKLEANAMLVGILSVMLESVETGALP